VLLKETIPRFGTPEGTASDNGPRFFAKIVQRAAKFLQSDWDLHAPWRPQTSGKVERVNRSLKRQLSGLCQDTQEKRTEIVALAVSGVSIAARAREGVSPFEVLGGQPYPVNKLTGKSDHIPVEGDRIPTERLLSRGRPLSSRPRSLPKQAPAPLGAAGRAFPPGEQVCVRSWKDEPLKERGEGPCLVLLLAPTAVEGEGTDCGIPYTRGEKHPCETLDVERNGTMEPAADSELDERCLG